MRFRSLLIRRRRIIMFYLLICFVLCTFCLILVVLLQPNRLISTYTRGSSAGYVYYTNKVRKRNILDFLDPSGQENEHEHFQDHNERAAAPPASVSAPNQDIHVVIGYYQGNDYPWMQSENLTEEILNTNMYSPDPAAGANGDPVFIPAFEGTKRIKLYQINRFNLLASDRIPINRTLPDVRRAQCLEKPYYTDSHRKRLPTTSIIVVFHNEAWSTLLRTVHSVIDRSPPGLLKEIILVDDASQRKFLKESLDAYVAALPVSVQVLRSQERVGLIKARLLGAEIAKGDVLTFLDAHCEVTTGWLEPLLARIAQNHKYIVSPVIDIINDETFQYVRSFELHQGAFNWELHFRWFSLPQDVISTRKDDPTQPFETPVMAGGLFSIDKAFFYELGAYDADMKIWGGENLEISFRGWMCGAILEILPCSHVGHLFRKSSPYTFPGGVGDVLNSNLARVALVWMDEWKDFYFSLHPEVAAHSNNQSVDSRIRLRSKMNCKPFSWYLEKIWPTHFFPAHDRFLGKIRNAKSRKCLQSPSLTKPKSVTQPYGQAALSECIYEVYAPQLFVLTPDSYIKTDDAVCLDAVQKEDGASVRIMACNNLPRQRWTYEPTRKHIVHTESGKCLDMASTGVSLELKACNLFSSSQQWLLEAVKWKKLTK